MRHTNYDFTIVIPSYWRDEKIKGKAVFDHPTELKEKGTLSRLLDSLTILDNLDGKIAIIPVPDNPKIYWSLKHKIDKILRPYKKKFDIFTFGKDELEKIKNKLKGEVSKDALDLLNFKNYAGVRNICSLAGVMGGGKYTIFIDDDEVFTDPNFLNKIKEQMGRNIADRKVKALAGYYLQPHTYRIDESKIPKWRKKFWNNAAAMNGAFDILIKQGPRLKPTSFVFGGNMAVSREILLKIPFDPKITRGEDIDFLINLKINGLTFYLDRELYILHLPPASNQESWRKLREDAVRFLYERKKVRDHSDEIDLKELQPYPGMFLGDDLEERIIKTSCFLMQEYMEKKDKRGVKECKKIIALAKENPYKQVDTRKWLKNLMSNWQKITSALETKI